VTFAEAGEEGGEGDGGEMTVETEDGTATLTSGIGEMDRLSGMSGVGREIETENGEIGTTFEGGDRLRRDEAVPPR
jgi:hypothetical protein